MTTYEMDDLAKKRELASQQATLPLDQTATGSQDSAEQVWALAVASIAVIMMIPLMFFPRFLLVLSGSEISLTPLERFLSHQLGILLLALAAGTLMATPEGTAISPDATSSHTHALLGPMSVAASLSALVAWNSKGVGSLGTFICVGNGIIGAWGFWTMLFAGSSRISKKTGADKHTSAFLFGNKKAASVQKKEWKARQKQL